MCEAGRLPTWVAARNLQQRNGVQLHARLIELLRQPSHQGTEPVQAMHFKTAKARVPFAASPFDVLSPPDQKTGCQFPRNPAGPAPQCLH